MKSISILERFPQLASREGYRVWRTEVLRHVDLDVNRHVTNTVIATFFDDGRYEFLRERLATQLSPDIGFVLATVQIDHIAELLENDPVVVGTQVLHVGGASFLMGQGLFVRDRCVATALATTVCFDRQARKSAAMPSACKEALLQWSRSPTSHP